jgi:hypothetical protein
MDEPVRRRLRPARRRGLTSPEPVTALPRPHAATRQNASQHPRQGHTDKPQKSKRPISHARRCHQDQHTGPAAGETNTRIHAVDRGLEHGPIVVAGIGPVELGRIVAETSLTRRPNCLARVLVRPVHIGKHVAAPDALRVTWPGAQSVRHPGIINCGLRASAEGVRRGW